MSFESILICSILHWMRLAPQSFSWHVILHLLLQAHCGFASLVSSLPGKPHEQLQFSSVQLSVIEGFVFLHWNTTTGFLIYAFRSCFLLQRLEYAETYLFRVGYYGLRSQPQTLRYHQAVPCIRHRASARRAIHCSCPRRLVPGLGSSDSSTVHAWSVCLYFILKNIFASIVGRFPNTRCIFGFVPGKSFPGRRLLCLHYACGIIVNHA